MSRWAGQHRASSRGGRCLVFTPGGGPHIYLSIFKSLLQVLVYRLIGDLAEQSEIGNSDLLLLCGVERGLLDVWFAGTARSTSTSGRRIARGSFLISPRCDTLHQTAYQWTS